MAQGKFFNPPLSQAFRLRREASIDATLNPPVASLKRRVATPLADPRIGRKAREHLQRAEGYTRPVHLSQAENTLTIALSFPHPCGKSCGKVSNL